MAALSKAEYLKRYMSEVDVKTDGSTKKKRRKKKVAGPTKPVKGLKIMDEDIDMSQVRAGYDVEDEEEPTVAEVIDERPEAVKRMEEYAISNKWKKVAADAPSQERNSSPSDKRANDYSPPRRRARHDSHSANSPQQQQEQPSPDHSPPRRKRHDSDDSPPRRERHDSDNSPPRRRRHDSSPIKQDSDNSPPRRTRHDSDQSPPRRSQRNSDSDQSPPRKRTDDSDQSPPRRTKAGSDQDLSPPRQKTLSGKAAGLSSAKAMKKEIEALKLKELERFNKIGDDRLGRNAETVFRDKKTGKKRDIQSEQDADDAKKAEWKDKYDKWGAGLAQGQAEETRVAEMVHEMSKPLARGKDDADLDLYLKDQDREGDPMLEFIKKKKEKKNKGPKYPLYKGPAPEPNRFGIRPGYRWDGVDRGNGFERKYFQSISKRKAVSSEAYKWSTEDM